MTGNLVQATRIMQGLWGYNVTEVDDLLARAAAELGDGRLAGPLIENAALRRARYSWTSGYDVDAVDWFLDQLARSPASADPGAGGGDPWRDSPVVNLMAGGTAASFAQNCQDAWNDFAGMPGERLVWQRLPHSTSSVLHAANQQPIASMPGPLLRPVELGKRTFRLHSPRRTPSSDPGVSQAVARSLRDGRGHYLAPAMRKQRWKGGRGKWLVRTLAGEGGTAVMYARGTNEGRRAWASISFPDQRWFRFPVRGAAREHAIMTAVDQAGNRVVRYRMTDLAVDIVVNPAWQLTDELILTIALSTRWLGNYFTQKGGG